MEYEWNLAKEVQNRRKHGVGFGAAARALEDPRRLELIDDRFNYREDRVQTIGMDRGIVLFVASVMRSETLCRIISARKATRNEQKKYFEAGPVLG